MNILFIIKKKHIKNYDFNEILNKNLCKLDIGFLLISLKTFASVDIITLKDFAENKHKKEYNHIFIDAKIQLEDDAKIFLPYLIKKVNSKVSIFCAYDGALINENVFFYEKFLDVSNYFVPNLLKNYDMYNLSKSIKDKLHPTHYGLGFINIPYNFKKKSFIDEIFDTAYLTDVFFSGIKSKTKETRNKVIDYIQHNKQINKKVINYYEEKDKKQFELKPDRYAELTKRSKINLVLSGNLNNITYRLYEVLFLKSFFLIDSYYLNYKISEHFENNSEFVFRNLDELGKKIEYYIENYDEANLVRSKQTESFKKFYDPEKHGLSIQKLIM